MTSNNLSANQWGAGPSDKVHKLTRKQKIWTNNNVQKRWLKFWNISGRLSSYQVREWKQPISSNVFSKTELSSV